MMVSRTQPVRQGDGIMTFSWCIVFLITEVPLFDKPEGLCNDGDEQQWWNQVDAVLA
ncbi:uncharacterized protein MYCFIDRAFT_209849 [Pseudocercospora fijiensis CIRAD86]|uniref:Uncharacterized protein n=1 Tax=Pseudocercospora fijiensis (strain CIRAD86) TaxID=383855 RepID=N1Q9W7_PSEFD|nr:uncharacterized protein MYCFIDRAFT_209849 [Pseudocercospora fijiensis CIRAD86]EME88586.1 hypothetical protein MYCFIDRAFT_209849 [Pseudocercospora fijiensis CIRAD86]